MAKPTRHEMPPKKRKTNRGLGSWACLSVLLAGKSSKVGKSRTQNFGRVLLLSSLPTFIHETQIRSPILFGFG